MNLVIFILLIWGVCAIINKVSAHARENARQREIERMKEEQTRQRMEQQRQREAIRQRERDAKEQARKQAEHDKAIAKAAKEREAMRNEQTRQAKEQERIAKEQRKQAEDMEKLKRTVETARFDIDFLLERTAELNAQLDYILLQQAGTVPGSKAFEKYQSKIVTLHNQIYSAENRLQKAQYNKAQAERKLNA